MRNPRPPRRLFERWTAPATKCGLPAGQRRARKGDKRHNQTLYTHQQHAARQGRPSPPPSPARHFAEIGFLEFTFDSDCTRQILETCHTLLLGQVESISNLRSFLHKGGHFLALHENGWRRTTRELTVPAADLWNHSNLEELPCIAV